MKTSEQIDKIAPAFVKAQAEFGKAVKDSKNPFFNSKYADLNSYLDGCSQALRENGLAVIQDTGGDKDAQIITVKTRLIHESGQWFESDPLVLHPTDMKPQSFGSAQTYGRRYSLASFLGLGAEDDDGNRASKPKPTVPQPKRSDINKDLQELADIGGFTDYAKKFQSKYGSGMWVMSSGKQGDKEGKETWKMLFDTHKNRITGIPPIDNRTPEAIQKEWKAIADKCADLETVNMLETEVNNNRSLDTEENWAVLEELHKSFD